MLAIISKRLNEKPRKMLLLASGGINPSQTNEITPSTNVTRKKIGQYFSFALFI